MGCVECQGIRMGPSKGKTASSDKVSLSLLSRNRELGWEADGPLGSPWEVVILVSQLRPLSLECQEQEMPGVEPGDGGRAR